ncbi:uncharacterized protein LOC116162964 [Photinus pyralis]|uniref:uncharacterized protein LOC116162964 n=1 Tax=Photinus pyralis TaxID=7054 RepID=UPI0012674B77|nr:uncharacterized protein LOC116162964 [Photinus pyralis]
MAQSYTHGPVKLPPDFDLQGQNAAMEWKFWKVAFEDYLVATGQHEPNTNVKLAILRNIIGTESSRIMCTIAIPDGTDDPYKYMMGQLEAYVNPRFNEVVERHKFLSRNQKEGESFEHFLTDIKHLVKSCNYSTIDPDETVEEKALRDKIVMGIRDTVTREALLRVDKLKLNKAIDICRASEMSRNQNKMFSEESAEVNTATKRHDKRKGSKQNDTKAQEKFKCKRCQSMHGPRECPAFRKPCTKCGILNHFAIACRVRNIKNVQQNVNSDSEDSCSSLFVNHVNFLGSSKDLWDEIVEIEDTKFKVKLDTGADVSVIPRKIFDKIDKQFKVRKSNYIIKEFEGTQAKSIGTVNLFCKYKNKNVYEDFVIIEGVNKILLGGQACVDLGLLKRINKVNIQEYNKNRDKDKFISENSNIFSGYGRFEGKYKITTVKKLKPVSYPPTRVPFAIKSALRDELDRLVQRKAIVKVEEIDPRASINRMVIVEKSNGKLRICLDPQDLNTQIVRKPHPVKKIEEVCSGMTGKKVFSVFDLAEGYHHLELDDSSSWKCCFATPFGIYRYTVLP